MEDRQQATPEISITTEELGRLVGLKKRATQNHLSHLFQQSRIDADRRTPLPGVGGASQPALPGAIEWAARVIEADPVFAPDPTCAKCLVALAGFGWSGQVDPAELAAAAGVSVRSVERHRPHLVKWDYVRFTIATVPTQGSRRFGGRAPSRYELMSGFYARPLSDEERVHVPARAAAIVWGIRWYEGVSPEERENAETAVGFVLRAGWPEAAILKALDATEDRNAFNPTGYLHTLLRKLRGQRYLIPAQIAFTGEGQRRLTECSVCHNITWSTAPEGRVLCGGGICLEAGTDHDTRDVLPLHRSA
ncbi:hypothetical protein QMK19_33820 [Streptomyces sp. H10-C2]|uniref:hypothetical protein n=1 Tax=unclassified Streptomyces TaxID=2593676 RepID=UPI0024BB87EA|nr:MULTISPECIES: hypothetical protein [unclassified Streptomyces]MDJ0345526.1 hypothetical protein [Streptomyces sp. PH10-H1]MDJ0374472.1 hypothetical protein [Streptomyces sp. H10-C2]